MGVACRWNWVLLWEGEGGLVAYLLCPLRTVGHLTMSGLGEGVDYPLDLDSTHCFLEGVGASMKGEGELLLHPPLGEGAVVMVSQPCWRVD